jgi:hypothetical protein
LLVFDGNPHRSSKSLSMRFSVKKITVLLSIVLLITLYGCAEIPSDTIVIEAINRCPPGSPIYHFSVSTLSPAAPANYHLDLAPGQTNGEITVPRASYFVYQFTDDDSYSRFETMKPTPGKNRYVFSLEGTECFIQATATPSVSTGYGIYFFIKNMCPAGSAMWYVKVEFVDRGFSQIYDYPAGTGESFHLDAGKYRITDWLDDGSYSRGPIDYVGVATSSISYRLRVCEHLALSTPVPDTATTYYFGNNCLASAGDMLTTWHWTFEPIDVDMPGRTIEVDLPVGGSQSGHIPRGTYMVGDWTDNGAVNNAPVERYIDGTPFQFHVNLCPDSPLLGDAPTR